MSKVDAIWDLSEKGLTHNEIASQVGLSQGAVSWYCVINGIKSRRKYKKPNTVPYKRGNVLVKPFTEEDDKLLLELESKGLKYGTIARLMGRNRNSVWARLATLAKYDSDL